MSDHIMPIDSNNKSVDTGQGDDVKCLAQTCIKQQPSGGEEDNTNEKKGASNVPYLDDTGYPKRRKTRRGKSKRRKLKPYSKLTWQERNEQEDNQTKLANKVRAQMFAHGQPVAPYNTTQFLMEDHNDLQDLDVQLKAVTTNSGRFRTNTSVFQRPSRVRDSSLSVDSDDDHFYSSPEDEEEFLTKEFSNAYEDLHAERLGQMSKSQLIEEYIQLEEKVDTLEKRLKKSQSLEIRGQVNDDTDIEKGEMQVDEETSRKMQLFQQEINKLLKENERLRLENDIMRRSYNKGDMVPSVSSSVDSESDSTCSSASNSSVDSMGRETGSAIESENKEVLSRPCDTNSAEVE
ncbi:hypothetical protein B7P43_G07038 [Cryptotermes secundus]|uniref:Protein HEXIM1 n=1 Tax=Cryptotermes secundus TaxID=105785 RepID=A0A2J7RDN2_9NEOP|nr:protein HEXIM [Cryptotermes secundus]PNF38941.1 hypothetical protein B7P43_G07038 [Cryptotermes secundus]